MRKHPNSDNVRRLSLYLDGMLDEAERAELERAMQQDEALRADFETLKKTSDLLRAVAPLPANPFFTEKTFNTLRREDERDALPMSIPRRYLPAFAGIVALLLVTVGVFTWWQGGGSIVRYVSTTGSEMQRLYEDDILKGWIMPLFQRTDEDNALEFAMFGTLPLNESETTTLHIDPSVSDGYRVELSGNPPISKRRASLEELYERIQPSRQQRESFDTLFSEACRHIESSVLLDKKQRIAIDPALPKYQKLLLTSIASQLDEEQHKQFQRYLSEHNTTYALAASPPEMGRLPRYAPMPPSPPGTVRATDFVVIAPDSAGITRMRLNMDSIRRLMVVIENRIPQIEEPLRRLARVFSERSSRPTIVRESSGGRVRVLPPDAPGESVSISVNIDAEFDEVMREMDEELEKAVQSMLVLRRIAPPDIPPPPPPPSGGRSVDRRIRVRVTDDRAREFEVNADSIMREVMKGLGGGLDSLEKSGVKFDIRKLFGPDGKFLIPLDSLRHLSIPGGFQIPEHLELELKMHQLDNPGSIRKLAPPEQLAPPEPSLPSPRRREAPPPQARPSVRVVQDTSVEI